MARIANKASKGRVMITMAIGLGAGVFYWLGIYKLAFWILVYAIVYGGLSVLREDWELAGRDAPHVDHVTDDLAGFLRGIDQR